MTPRVFATTAWISHAAQRAMEDQAARHGTDETGGLLMGHVAPSRGAVVITTVIGPGPRATHEPMRYVPDHEWQEGEVARLQAATDGQLRYLGDWHSHPGGALALSDADRRTLRTIASAPAAGLPAPLMAILAGGGRPPGSGWRLGVWQGALTCRYWRYQGLTVRALEIRRFA